MECGTRSDIIHAAASEQARCFSALRRAQKGAIALSFAADSHTGMQRADNQDSYAAFALDGAEFGIVADGMGGHAGGKTASAMAIESIGGRLRSEYTAQMTESQVCSLLKECFSEANMQIYEKALKEPALRGMGTTVTLAMIRGEKAVVAHAGDSRAYLVKDGEAVQVTTDHTLVQDLMDRGEITPQEALAHPKKHMITRALGTEPSISTDIYTCRCVGQTLILCSDGLTNMLDNRRIAAVVCEAKNLEDAVHALVREANSAGGTDNITVVAMQSDEQGGKGK